jgi:hypothetical protein
VVGLELVGSAVGSAVVGAAVVGSTVGTSVGAMVFAVGGEPVVDAQPGKASLLTNVGLLAAGVPIVDVSVSTKLPPDSGVGTRLATMPFDTAGADGSAMPLSWYSDSTSVAESARFHTRTRDTRP